VLKCKKKKNREEFSIKFREKGNFWGKRTLMNKGWGGLKMPDGDLTKFCISHQDVIMLMI
jgi:hypothetical protein